MWCGGAQETREPHVTLAFCQQAKLLAEAKQLKIFPLFKILAVPLSTTVDLYWNLEHLHRNPMIWIPSGTAAYQKEKAKFSNYMLLEKVKEASKSLIHLSPINKKIYTEKKLCASFWLKLKILYNFSWRNHSTGRKFRPKAAISGVVKDDYLGFINNSQKRLRCLIMKWKVSFFNLFSLKA